MGQVVLQPLRTPIELLREIDASVPTMLIDAGEDDRHELREWLREEVPGFLTPYDLIVVYSEEGTVGAGEAFEEIVPVVTWDGAEGLAELAERWMAGEFVGGNGDVDNEVAGGLRWESRFGARLREAKMRHQAVAKSVADAAGRVREEMPVWKAPKAFQLGGLVSRGVEKVIESANETLTRVSVEGLEIGASDRDAVRGGRLPLRDEEYDASWCTAFLWWASPEVVSGVASELWRGVRPGGRIVWIDEVVTPPGAVAGEERRSIMDLIDIFSESMCGEFSMDWLESIDYPDDPYSRCVLLILRRLGIPGSL
jgi:hypothetical protein